MTGPTDLARVPGVIPYVDHHGHDYTITPFASVVLSPHPAPLRLVAQFAPSQGPEGALIPVG
ncbi:hypothetical protein [Amycolatopsis vastitatis]|uniref:Uncharacterized protein n=1 Tax=Amycolatopsis vastitatis TaxID=1905142 RepID=A0A229TH57_9PSEU|nr:hypothetical protein [Amycolatopsis vastitatis]OXM70582.1 hypothetical protein CF165_05855 [Amycolatopsis vastitatis]